MIGTLSVKHGLLLTQVFVGTNTVDSFLPFVKALKKINPLHKRIVVMDNLSVHHSKIAKKNLMTDGSFTSSITLRVVS